MRGLPALWFPHPTTLKSRPLSPGSGENAGLYRSGFSPEPGDKGRDFNVVGCGNHNAGSPRIKGPQQWTIDAERRPLSDNIAVKMRYQRTVLRRNHVRHLTNRIRQMNVHYISR